MQMLLVFLDLVGGALPHSGFPPRMGSVCLSQTVEAQDCRACQCTGGAWTGAGR